MIKEELVNYFSYYIKEKTIEDLRNDASSKGYSPQDINDSLDSLKYGTANQIKKTAGAWKIILLSVLILIVLVAIGVVIYLNLKPTDAPEEINLTVETSPPNFEEVNISTVIFDPKLAGNSSETYFLNYPAEKISSIKLSENLRDCKNTSASFFGPVPELNGSLVIKENGAGVCSVSYQGDLTVDCNYTLEQLGWTYQGAQQQNSADLLGPVFYYGDYLDLKIRGLIGLARSKINETYNQNGRPGSLTLGENPMASEINKTIANPQTGKEEVVKCLVY